MKPLIFSILLFFQFAISNANDKVIIKASILRGDNFVTANTDPQIIEDIFKTAFSQKNFQVVNEINSNDELLFVDLFVYQFAAEFPTVTITIRTSNGIHFIDAERTKIFVDRSAANVKLAKKLAEKLPPSINKNAIFKLTTNDLLSSNSISFIPTKTERSKSSNSTIKWFGKKVPEFIIPNEINYYIAYISNNYAVRNKLKNNSVILTLKINNQARFELIDIQSKVAFTEKEKNKLKDFLNGFPLWIVKNPIEKIEMKIGIE